MYKKDKYVSIATLLCSIDSFVLNDFGICDWRLDPYGVPKNNEHQCQFFVERCFSEDTVCDLPQELLLEEPTGFYVRRIFRKHDSSTVWTFSRRQSEECYLRFDVSSAWDRVRMLRDTTNTNGQCAYEYLGLIIPSVMLAKNEAITFHGVLMEYAGRGIIISAPSGTGKTTHARMWRDLYNALIINGDRSICKKINGTWTGYGTPWSGTSGEQINRSVPISAMVVLEQSEKNYAEVLTGLETFAAILPNLQCPRWDTELTSKAMDLVNDFLIEVPIIRLYCRPEAEAVNVLKATLESL